MHTAMQYACMDIINYYGKYMYVPLLQFRSVMACMHQILATESTIVIRTVEQFMTSINH